MDPQTIHHRMAVAAGRLTYRDVAELTGAHPESVRRYMTGDMPGVEFVAAFCAGLGICADWLILGTGPMSSNDSLRAALGRVTDDDLFAALADNLAEPPEPAALEPQKVAVEVPAPLRPAAPRRSG